MSWFSTILGWFTGGGKTVEKVTEIADEAFHTEQEKAQEDAVDMDKARQFTPGEKWDSFIDKWHRAIRPAVATWAVGILFGWIAPPLHWAAIPGEVWGVILVIITFYFGGRGFLQDVRTRLSGNGKSS